MTIHQQLTLSLSPKAKATLSAFAAAKCLGQYQEARQLERQYRITLEAERRKKEIEFWRQRELRERREENDRLNEEAWIDSFETLPTGKIGVWRRARAHRENVDIRAYDWRSNRNKRNYGRKPRRFW